MPPWNIFAMNVIGSSLLATGVLSSLYAGVLAPELRMTTGQLSAVANFVGTITTLISSEEDDDVIMKSHHYPVPPAAQPVHMLLAVEPVATYYECPPRQLCCMTRLFSRRSCGQCW